MKNKRIWIVSELFYPDEASTGYIMTSIAKSLGKATDVHVICGPVGYTALKSNSNPGVIPFTIHRINLFNFNKNSLFGRLARLILLSLGMFFKGLIKIRRSDSVFIVTNPAFSVPMFSLLKFLKGFRYTILVHDVFPENLYAAKLISSRKNMIYRLLESIFNVSYRRADHLIVLGRDMEQVMHKKTKGIPISVIENWADTVNIKVEPFLENRLVRELGLQDKYVFLFAGNIGRLQGLDSFFGIIREITNRKIHFIFIGNGVMLDELKAYTASNSLQNVTFLDSFPRNQQNVFLNACHFGMVTLDNEMYGLGVPSKSYNILAAGKPILFYGNKTSEIALMIGETGCGIIYDEAAKQQLLQFFNNLSDTYIEKTAAESGVSRKLAETKYSKEAILAKFDNLLLNES